MDYKPTNAIHADKPGVYISDKILSLSTKDKIHLKCEVFDGSVVNGIREPMLFSFFCMSQLVINYFECLRQFII